MSSVSISTPSISISGIPTTTRRYESSSDFVKNVTEIVRKCSESHDYTHVGESLRKLRASLPTDVSFKETLNALLAQVKEVTPGSDLPVVYRHLIQDLELAVNKDYLALAGLSPADEGFRIACAVLTVEAFPTKLASNIRKYGITDQEALIKLATIAATRDGYCLARCIAHFGILDEEARLQIALVAAKSSPTGLAECIKNFGITQEKYRIALAREALTSGNDIFGLLPNFEIQDESALVDLTLLAIEKNPGKVMRTSLKSIGIKKDESLFAIAKGLVEKSTIACPFNIDRFPIANEEMRFELAKRLAVIDPVQLAMTFRKFQITNPEWRSAVAKCVAAQEDNRCLGEYIRYFEIEFESDRIALAKAVAKKNGGVISCNIRLFEIKSEKARIEIAELAAMQDGGTFSKGVGNFEIKNPQALFRLAKLAAQQNGVETSRYIRDYGIEDPIQRIEIFLIAMQENVSAVGLLSNYAFSLEEKAVLFSRYGAEFIDELPVVFTVLVSEKGRVKPKTIVESYPEYIGFGADGNLTQCVSDLWEVENIPFSSLQFLYQRAQILDQESSKMGSKAQILLSLEISAMRFANGSPELFRTLLDEIIKIEMEGNPETWKHLALNMLSLFLECRTLKISRQTLARHRDIFSAIMTIRDAQVRSDLIRKFVGWLSTAPEPLQLKSKALALASVLLSPFVARIPKFQQLIQLKGFKDELKLKALLQSLGVLINNTLLTDEEKLYILNRLIFVKAPGLNVDKQSKRILESAEIVAQFIRCGQAQALLDIQSFDALSMGKMKLYERILGIPLELCQRALPQTVEKWRKPQSLLTYAGTLSKLPDRDRNALLHLLKKFTLSVLKGTFREERYATEEEASSHWLKLHERAPALLQEWKKGSLLEDNVVDTDDPCDLLLAGTEMGSCQRVDGDPSKAKCLVAYLWDPKIRMMAVKNKEGATVARSMLRLLWDDGSKRFVLFQEYNYPRETDANAQKLDAACIKRAKELGVPLFRKIRNPQSKTEGTTLKAFKGTIPYEYVDSTDTRIETDRGYEIPRCECCFMPEEG